MTSFSKYFVGGAHFTEWTLRRICIWVLVVIFFRKCLPFEFRIGKQIEKSCSLNEEFDDAIAEGSARVLDGVMESDPLFELI